jgi:hypothetical protein
MKEEKDNKKNKATNKNKILREDDGKRTPPTHAKDVTGAAHAATRPELRPDVPPQEHTEGIP